MTSTDLAVVTWTCVAVIIISAIMSGVYIQSQNSKGNLIAKRRWIQQLPSLIYAFRSKCSQFLALRVKRKLFTI